MRWLLLGLLFAVPASLIAQQEPPDKSKPDTAQAIRLSDIPDNQFDPPDSGKVLLDRIEPESPAEKPPAWAQPKTARQDWYPKASDLCAEYVTKSLKTATYRLVSLTKDPAIAKYVADFNAATGTNDKGGLASIDLLIYCTTHAATKLGDVTAQAVISNFETSTTNSNPTPQTSQPGAPSPSNPEQRELADQWAWWLKQSLDFCGANERCKEIANRSFANGSRCATGDRLACDEHARDVADWNAQRPAAQANPQHTLMQCLQETATRIVTWCRNTGCDTGSLVDTIGLAQKTQCGYSAIEPIQPLDPRLTRCTTRSAAGGKWITECTQY